MVKASNILPFVPPSPATEMLALLQEETDSGLLKLMADKEKDADWADAAFKEFYNRHANYLWGVCDRVAEELKGEAWVTDLFTDTFLRAYTKAARFKLPSGVVGEHEVRTVRAWLGKIATNILRTILRGREQEQTQDDEIWSTLFEKRTCEEEESPSPEHEKRIALIEEAIGTLNDREQHVIRVTFTYYRVGEKHQRLPNSVCQDLAETLGTTPEYLRKIRERALKKIKDFVSLNITNQNGKSANERKEG